MLSTSQIVDYLFKKWLGLGDTSTGRQFFNEPIRGRSFIVNSQIWGQSDQIPNTAPSISSGVVQKVTNYQLTQVGGTTSSFTGALFQNIIPFNWGDGTSYNYAIVDSLSNPITFGVDDWVVDTEAGVLMFNNGLPANMPPSVSFYRYSGIIGINTGAFITTGQTGAFGGGGGTGTGSYYPLNSNPSGYLTGFNSGIYATVANLNSSGANLQSEINTLSGIITGAGISGSFILSGSGSTTITSIGNTIIIGSTGTTINTGVLTGTFYPLLSNPSGYITSSQTGAFYATSNPVGYITGFNSGLYTLNTNTGNFITSSQTGNFVPVSNTLFVTSGNLQVINSQYPYGLFEVVMSQQAVNIGDYVGSAGNTYLDLNDWSQTIQINANSGVSINSVYGVSINGHKVITDNQTGIFYAASNPNAYITASSLTPYYLNSNPSGFITGETLFNSKSGTYITTGQTGQFASAINLGTTGSYLLGLINASSAGVSSLNSASGALSLIGAGNVTISTAGQTITVSGNTGSYISFVNTGQTGNFITTSQTGAFYAVSNPAGYITASSLVPYYLNSNPSGFITGFNSGLYALNSNTGNFITTSQTGAFAGNTGILTGVFYPLFTNPSNYITSSQTGQFYSVNNPLGFITGFNSGLFTLNTNTGNFITVNQTGQFYANNNPSGFLSPISFTLSTNTTLNSAVDIGNVSYGNNAISLEMAVTVSSNSYSVAKYYNIVSQAGGGTMPFNSWIQINPTATTGPYGYNDFAVDALLSGALTYFRLRRTGGGNAGIANINIIQNGFNGQLFTQTFATGIVSAPTQTYSFDTLGIIYYPLTNPSGFITGFNSGIYTLNSNTGSFITTSQTGAFYATSNPARYITGFNSGLYTLNSNTGSFITTGQTGAFGGSASTGALTGVFYPLNFNPSGYFQSTPPNGTGTISGILNVAANSGTLILTSTALGSSAGYHKISFNTSSFGEVASIYTVPTANWGGGNYGNNIIFANTLNGNPPLERMRIIDSGYIGINQIYPSYHLDVGGTGNFSNDLRIGGASVFNLFSPYIVGTNLMTWTGGSTGLFYPLSTNPSGYITGFNSGIYTLNSNTGSFITTSQTGAFYATSNPARYITGFNSGLYTLNSNTGSFITTGQTGAFGGSASTGALTGVFYPLNTNPSGYIIPSQTGAFYSSSNPNNYVSSSNRTLSDSTPTLSIDWQNRILNSTLYGNTVNWQSGVLLSGSTINANWITKILSGNWSAQSLAVSGFSVVTTNQTGAFGGSATGNYMTTGQAVSNWTNLTCATTTSWAAAAATVRDKKILILTGNSTLNITSLYNGWNGILKIVQSGSNPSGNELTMPARAIVVNGGAGAVTLTSNNTAIDVLNFDYDGTNLMVNVFNNFN